MRRLPRAIPTRVTFLTMTVLLSLFVMPSRYYPLNSAADASPEKLAAGTAATPYQYRVLVPWIARHTTPDLGPETLHRRYWQLEFGALLALGLCFRSLLLPFVASSDKANILALSIYLLLPLHYRLQDFYPYDTPSMVFMTAGMVLIFRGQWGWFYPLFILATLNRETSWFLTAVTAAVWIDRQPLLRTCAHVAAQAVAWVMLKWYLFNAFGHQGSGGYGLFEPQFKMNIALLVGQPLSALAALSTWAYLWVAVVARFNRIGHPDLRRALLAAPLYVAAMVWVGVMTETRIYGELLPIVLAGALVVLTDFMAGRPSPPST